MDPYNHLHPFLTAWRWSLIGHAGSTLWSRTHTHTVDNCVYICVITYVIFARYSISAYIVNKQCRKVHQHMYTIYIYTYIHVYIHLDPHWRHQSLCWPNIFVFSPTFIGCFHDQGTQNLYRCMHTLNPIDFQFGRSSLHREVWRCFGYG